MLYSIIVQEPLYYELQLLAGDERVSKRWRDAALQRRDELRQLRILISIISMIKVVLLSFALSLL